MEITVTPRNVMAVVIEVDRLLKAKSRDMKLNQAEVMLGLQELVGRLIVEMANTTTSADTLAKHSKQHLDNTVAAGMATKGHPLGTRVPS